ncbi:hypothetical protein PAXRUDRAFT_821669 [Paxillus rubicundulus Ve08.2h10]|uniref:18S rRNA factor 2 n=1 Tax=Paxillus rubicundulus Ve08.2h10 TaxID=930991 RepID=A0A0D0ED43_9AGAM|nr:hypothetical protein PAXRUDRAFT_821669 [Paxillus rubicundulus Ve08.2h10]
MAKQTSVKHRSEQQTKSSRAEEGPTSRVSPSSNVDTDEDSEDGASNDSPPEETYEDGDEGTGDLIDSEAYTGPSKKVVKPLTSEALAAFNAAQARTGVTYISRIPPGMQPAKVRHLMSQYGEVGRVYLQQEDAKTAYLRRKHTTTKKPHFVEGWVEFKDKKVARSVAEMLNAQPIGGKKGTRWYDDVWTMKYLPKFKWNMLTEQIAHEAAVHTAKLRVELAQSRLEQRDYLRNVELARVLDKRNEKRKEQGQGPLEPPQRAVKRRADDESNEPPQTPGKRPHRAVDTTQLDNVLGSVFQ